VNRAFGEAPRAADPLACFDLHTLLEGAARLRPERLALSDPFESLTFGAANARASALAAAFQELGLTAGETILLAAGAPALGFVALLAALRAQLNVALAPAWTTAAAGGRMALRTGASALIVAPGDPELGSTEAWMPAAADAPSVRVVCSVGGEPVDGAFHIDPARLAESPSTTASIQRAQGRIYTFEKDEKPVSHAQRTLIAAALDVVARARFGMLVPVLSTIPPTSFAGLVAGPVGTLIAGASLSWRVPFESRSFIRALDEARPAHLVAPAALAPMLARAGLLDGAALASLVLMMRRENWASSPPPHVAFSGDAERTPIVDLYVFGEKAAAAETRGADCLPVSPVKEPHYLEFDGTRILALDWSSQDSLSARLEGAAVSGD
jgi:acyl-CoA synthetase (AMP-forming)/AMP-acid ligase II